MHAAGVDDQEDAPSTPTSKHLRVPVHLPIYTPDSGKRRRSTSDDGASASETIEDSPMPMPAATYGKGGGRTGGDARVDPYGGDGPVTPPSQLETLALCVGGAADFQQGTGASGEGR